MTISPARKFSAHCKFGLHRKGIAIAGIAALCLGAILAVVTASAQTTSPNGLDPDLVTDLVYANRILADQGVLDGFGHVSVRETEHPDRFLLSRSMAPALVTANDIMEYDSQGEPIKTGGPNSYLERYIHAAIYRARPDVKSIVHSHSGTVIAFAITGTELRPVYHMSSFLGTGAPIFDIRKVAGETDMLISNNQLGDALAKALGERAVVLMRGHGFVAVGNSIHEAVFRAIYTQVNAEIQLDATRLGSIEFLSPEEASKAAADVGAQLNRSWDLWKRHVGDISTQKP